MRVYTIRKKDYLRNGIVEYDNAERLNSLVIKVGEEVFRNGEWYLNLSDAENKYRDMLEIKIKALQKKLLSVHEDLVVLNRGE